MSSSEIQTAVKRLELNADYLVVRKWVEDEHTASLNRLVGGDANNDTFVRVGMSRAFGFVLKTMTGGK